MLTWTDYAKIFTAMLVIVNPVGAMPMFASLTATHSLRQRRRTASIAALTVGLVLIAACLVGEPVLRGFGISISSFQVGGGILILLRATAMMYATPASAEQTPEEEKEAGEKDSIGVVPLGVPLLAGPGAISTVIIYAHASTDWFHSVVLVAASLVVAVAVWIALRLAIPAGALLGTTGINIATRLMGLLLAAIAVEFIAKGVRVLLPGLG